MNKHVRYWLLFILTIVGAGAAGYGAGDILGAITAACSAGVGLLQPNPAAMKQGEG